MALATRQQLPAISLEEQALLIENAGLRHLLAEAGLAAARLLAQAGIEATETEVERRLQRLLLEELHHRVKNTLATVAAITSQTLRHAETLDEGRIAIANRLMAMGNAHDLLLQVNLERARLADVIRIAIEPYERAIAPRFTVEDTELHVGAAAVLPLTMSLNELCTNAVKYGALATEEGRVAIAPKVDEAAQSLRLLWTESGGPEMREPTRRGFGTRLIDRLATQLNGTVNLAYAPGGFIYELQIPLASLQRAAD